MRGAQELWKKRTTRKKEERHYQGFGKGDQVWLEGTNLKSTHPCTKLAAQRWGPFTIIQVLPSGINFRLELPVQWKIHLVFHASLLTPYKETEEHGRNFEQPPPDLIEGEPEYKVEQIISSRRVGHKKKVLQYLLRWKGYSQAHDSWEPAKQVYAPELVKEFYDKNPLAIRTVSTLPTQPILSNTSQPHSPSSYLMQPLINYVTDKKYQELKDAGAIVWEGTGRMPDRLYYKEVYI